MVISSLAYLPIAGKPLIMYLGIATLISITFTALIGYLNFRGNITLPFSWHPKIAAVTLILAFLHGLLGLLSYLQL